MITHTKNILTLTLPQVRLLRAAQSGTPLTRTNLVKKAGFTVTSGMLGIALRGRGKHKGLIELGLLSRKVINVEGVGEVNYCITHKGKHALAKVGKKLPKLRDKTLCTNHRYQEVGDVKEEPRAT